MRLSWLMLAVFTLSSTLSGVVVGQALEDDDQDAALAPSLAASLQQWVQYGIVSGRVVGVSGYNGNSTTHNRVNPAAGKRERVSIDVTSGLPTVHYEMTSPQEDLTIELVEADQFTVRRVAKDAQLKSLEFQQPRRGDMTLSVGTGSQRRPVQAASLWHLAIAEPELCRTELFPLLEMLRPSWHLTPFVGAIEESLSRWAGAHRVADRRVWMALIDHLASTSFADRQAAERKLLDAGPAVLPFLENLDRARLDAEQRSRIQDLVVLLDDYSEDTVDRIVTWLAADPEVWFSMLVRPDESRRRLSAQQLSQLLGGPIDFDPAASAQTREAQIAQLRVRLRGGSAAPAR